MTAPHLPPVCLTLRLAADAFAVRDGLHRLLSAAPLKHVPVDLRGSVEIVLAEILNNIVEHAYAESGGYIDVTLEYEHPGLKITVVDTGRQMPSGRLPPGELAAIDADDDLSEGGFGWFLIRSLTRDLVYHRSSDRNMLTFRMQTD